KGWFGSQVTDWRHLKTVAIQRALPTPSPASSFPEKAFAKHPSGVFVAGDHLASASIEGAMISGVETAKATIEILTNSATR
ncbi:MAG: FAD-dependent oxidoreductase, partial [Verrucomicrobiota bacterium]